MLGMQPAVLIESLLRAFRTFDPVFTFDRVKSMSGCVDAVMTPPSYWDGTQADFFFFTRSQELISCTIRLDEQNQVTDLYWLKDPAVDPDKKASDIISHPRLLSGMYFPDDVLGWLKGVLGAETIRKNCDF